MRYGIIVCFVFVAGMLLNSPAMSFATIGGSSIQSDTVIYTNVDVLPQFPSGRRGWNSFLNKNLNLQMLRSTLDEEVYVQYGITQRALLEFTVCEDGRVCDIEVVNADKISPEFAEEVVRVMNRSPKWTPAKIGDKKVRTRFRQPVTVNLKD